MIPDYLRGKMHLSDAAPGESAYQNLNEQMSMGGRDHEDEKNSYLNQKARLAEEDGISPTTDKYLKLKKDITTLSEEFPGLDIEEPELPEGDYLRLFRMGA